LSPENPLESTLEERNGWGANGLQNIKRITLRYFSIEKPLFLSLQYFSPPNAPIVKIQPPTSLQKLNTFGIAATAKGLVEVKDVATLSALVAEGIFLEPNTLLLGGGSNLLLTKNVEGVAIKMAIPGI
jgi:hypothetical protein